MMQRLPQLLTPLTLTVLALFAPGLLSRAGDGTATTQTQSVPQSQPTLQTLQTQYARLLADLNHQDYKIRTAAQARLDAMSWEKLDDLRRLAAAASDPEVSARLAARIEFLEDQLASAPPHFSLDLKNASLNQIRTTLADFGVRINADPADSPPHFTLKESNLSFSALVEKLQRQNLFALDFPDGIPNFSAAPPDKIPFFLHDAILLPYYTSNAVGAGMPPRTYMAFSLLIDPRVQIAAVSAQIDRIQDEFSSPVAIESLIDHEPPAPVHQLTFVLTPNKNSERIAVLKGHFKVTVAVRVESVTFDHPEDHLKKPVTLGKASLSLESFEASTQKVQVMAGSGPDEAAVQAALLSGAIRSPAELFITGKIIDAKNRTILTIAPNSGSGISCDDPQNHIAEMPVKIFLTVPTRTKELLIPFELRNLSLNADW